MDTPSTFSGFPQAGLEFLANLAAHNNREWFEAHKNDYQVLLLEPAQEFVLTLGAKLQVISNGIRCDTRTDGKGVLMRLHRDTRFSPDKSPYHTHLSGLFWEGSQKKTERPAFGFQIEATGMALMTGIFKFPPAMLAAYREVVSDEREDVALEEVLETVRRAGHYDIAGKHYQRVPSGYDPNHRRADLLRYNGLSAFSPRLAVSDLLTPALVDLCSTHFQQMAPLYHWLMKMAMTLS
jgi:uncharacterized protein (TIGR02453 family)